MNSPADKIEYKIEALKQKDLDWLEKNRIWLREQMDDAEDYMSIPAKLNLINAILAEPDIGENKDKLIALGIAFGDALLQQLSQLSWVAYEEQQQREPALRWKESSILVFAQTAILNRVVDGLSFDAFVLFGDFQVTLEQAVGEHDET